MIVTVFIWTTQRGDYITWHSGQADEVVSYVNDLRRNAYQSFNTDSKPVDIGDFPKFVLWNRNLGQFLPAYFEWINLTSTTCKHKEDYFPKDIFLVIIEKSYIFWLEAVFILGWFAIKWIGYFSPEYSVFTKTKVFPTARRFYNISGKRMPEFLSVGSLQLGNFYKSKFISETAINMLDDRRIALFYLQGCTKRRKLLPYVLLETLITAKIRFLIRNIYYVK